MVEKSDKYTYKCPTCDNWTNGKWGNVELCWDCYKETVASGEITPPAPWPINWERVKPKG